MAEMEMGYSGGVGSDSGQASGGTASAAKEKLYQAKDKVGGAAKTRVVSKLDEQKSQLVQGLDKIADSIEEVGQSLSGPQAQIASRVAGYVRQAHGVLERKSADELVNMAVSEIKDRPGIVIGAMFAVGFLGARFLKS